MSFDVEQYGNQSEDEHNLDLAYAEIKEQQTLLKDIFNDITKDKRLSPDTFDKLVEAAKQC